jgi:RNA polymerase sigma factor (sigma-70 family)
MNRRNNGTDGADILQNKFTAYLVTAVRRKKKHYRRMNAKTAKHELLLEAQDVAAASEMTPELPALDQVENPRLYRALAKMKQRDLDILLARAVGGKTCAELSGELGIDTRHIATIYSRVTKKIKKEMKKPDELS